VRADEGIPIRSAGGTTRADAEISNEKKCENHFRRKPKGSRAR
jgi:hypothetical protein